MKKIVVVLVMIQLILISNGVAQSLVNELKNSVSSHAPTMMSSNQNKDALAIFSNPGLVASYDKINVNAAGVSYLDQSNSLSAGAVVPVENGLAIGFAFSRISNQNAISPFATVKDEMTSNKVGFNENLYLVSIGRTFRSGLSAGINMKACQQTVGGQASNLVPGVDVGVTYSFNNFEMLEQTVLSAAIVNFSQPEIEIGAESVTLPRFYRLGVERTVDVGGRNAVVISSVNYSKYTGAKFQLAIEYDVNGFGSATIGWDQNQRLYMGGRINLGDFQVSVGQIYSNNSGYYSVSLGYTATAGWF